MDVARAHRLALEAIVARGGVHAYNVGRGRGFTVLELIDAFERTTGREVAYRVGPRRAGDVPVCIADVRLARDELGWTAERDIDRICADAMRWRRFWLDCMRPSIDAPALSMPARGRHAQGRPRLRQRPACKNFNRPLATPPVGKKCSALSHERPELR